MNIYTIYKATNVINNKFYIGFDSNWPNRKKHHLKSNKKYLFCNAIKKYGKDNFIWEPIYQSKNAEHTLKIMEPYFIKEYNSYENGYNMTLGGEGTFGYKPTKETLEKIRKAQLGKKKHNDEYKINMSKLHKGKIVSEETKHKLSISGKKSGIKHSMPGKNNPSSKKYIFINPDGKIFTVFGEFDKFCKENRLSKNTMRNCLYKKKIPIKGSCLGWFCKYLC